jgi:penicillin-binding protein 1C
VSARRRRRWWLAAAAPLLASIALGLYVASLPVCPEREAQSSSVRVLDRDGRLLASVRSASGEWSEPVRLDEVSEWVVPALLAAEDQRFFQHPGVDPLAILRALGQALTQGRIVSGASTLTQQLVRQGCERPRGVLGKLRELALALRLEASWSKARILEGYLNQVSFGPRVIGIGAASRRYFDKPPSALGLADAAALVAVVRGPSLYDPERALELVRRRRDRILERLSARGDIPAATLELARTTPLALRRPYTLPGAYHFVRAALNGKLAEATAPPAAEAAPASAATTPAASPAAAATSLSAVGVNGAELRTTLDAALQQEVEALVAAEATHFIARRASAAAVIVVDNASAEVLAYVGSPDYSARDRLGQNDGVLALRQPGSALKPFVYTLGLDELGLHASSILPDIELSFSSAEGSWAPVNYDGRFHGPVRLRPALASSLNVPAVYLADRLGPARLLDFLHRIGFRSLSEPAEHYGPALALGSGEVRLSELAAGYATLARGGLYLPLVFAPSSPHGGTRVLDVAVAAQIGDVLADPAARAAGFGRDGVLELDFPVAAKTGTSKGYRDNWALGYSARVTVGVWVGNFDGSPMVDSSGVSGAGPLFHAVMQSAARRFPAAGDGALAPADVHATSVRICPLSGLRAGPDCPHVVEERYYTRALPARGCDWHERVWVDAASGARSSERCEGAERRVFERYPSEYRAWAEQSRRPLPPSEGSARCAGGASALQAPAATAPSIVFPAPGASFVIDPAIHREQQLIVLAARAGGGKVRFVLDGRELGSVGPPYELPWRLTPGRHELRLENTAGQSPTVVFSVR